MDMTDKLLNSGEYTFEELFFGGYFLTVEEAAEMLNMSQRYIYDRTKSRFDYISVTIKETHIFYADQRGTILPFHQKAISKMYPNKDAAELSKYFDKLVRKRMFINKKSFRKFLLQDLKVVIENPITGEIIYKPVQTWQVDHILKGKAKLHSINSLKTDWMLRHNMQVYRRLNGMEFVKIALITNSSEQPMIRYLFNDK